jgi:hypothetical protein
MIAETGDVIRSIWIESNDISATGNGSIASSPKSGETGQTRDVLIANNMIRGGGGNGILSASSGSATAVNIRWTIVGNTLVDLGLVTQSGNGIETFHVQDLLIVGNIISDVYDRGIDINGATFGENNGIQIIGNSILDYGSGTHSGVGNMAAIQVVSAKDVLIEGNRCRLDASYDGATSKGIEIGSNGAAYHVEGFSIIGNLINMADTALATTEYPIYVLATGTTGGVVANNHIINPPAHGSWDDDDMVRCDDGTDATTAVSGVYKEGVLITNRAGFDETEEIIAQGGFRQQLDGWYQETVAASQTAVVLDRDLASAFVDSFIPVRSGSITGVCVRTDDARTAGTCTIEVYKNGAGTGLTAVLDGTNATFKATTQAKATDTFVAGDRIDLRVTTDAGWLPATANIRCSIEVET